MLIPAAVDYAFSRGDTEFDFLSGEEPYKMQWTKGFHHTYRLMIWNRRWVSRLRAYRNVRLLPPISAQGEAPHAGDGMHQM
jgi:CelD/BcsL family acetyltransferase involved in cellulose biosynthesis